MSVSKFKAIQILYTSTKRVVYQLFLLLKDQFCVVFDNQPTFFCRASTKSKSMSQKRKEKMSSSAIKAERVDKKKKHVDENSEDDSDDAQKNRSKILFKSQMERNNNKCAWCERQRERNDLCNRCRQKVESRARTLNEQKMMGDCQVIHKISVFFQNHLNFSNIHSIPNFCQTFIQAFPFLVWQR